MNDERMFPTDIDFIKYFESSKHSQYFDKYLFMGIEP